MYKVLIRPLCIEDAKISYRWRNDTDIWRYTGNRPNKEITEKIEIDWIKKANVEETSKRFAILADNQYIGNIQLTNISQEKKDAEYHIFIGEKSFWGKGIATLATSQIIHYAKEYLDLENIYLFVKPENEAAIKVYQKSGFKKINEEIRMNLNLNEINTSMVSVFMMTYNHENYIAQALEGVLMQKVNFNYQIVLGEDCSTDKTREIILRYADQYPGKFKLILHKKNIGAMANQLSILKACSGKYVAICEGDDYWTDPYKLQKQVDFLEANEDFVICHHNMQVIYEDGRQPHLSNPPDHKEVTTIEDLANGNYIYTASCVFRNGFIKEFPEWYKDSPVGDYVLHMLNAQHGSIKYYHDAMGVYRVHKGGLWGNNNMDYMIPRWTKMLNLMIGNFNDKVNNILLKQQLALLNNYKINESSITQKIVGLEFFPKCFWLLIKEVNDASGYRLLINSRKYKLYNFLLRPFKYFK